MRLPTRPRVGRLARTLSRSLLTLGAALAALAASRTGADAAPRPVAPPRAQPGSPLPAQVVGRWYAGSASPSEYMNPNTGHWYGNGYGSGLSYTFNTDGTYARAFLTFVRSGSCGIRQFTYTTGTVTVGTAPAGTAPAVLVLQPTAARSTWQNTCSGETSARAIAGEAERLYYSPGTDAQGAPALWLRTDESTWTAFRPLERFTR